MKSLATRNIYKIKLLFFLTALTIMFVSLMLYAITEKEVPKEIVLNEICSNNFSLYRDEYKNYSDYIELYNASEKPIVLDGLFLSDDVNELQKLALKGITLQPGEYYAIWLNQNMSGGGTVFQINASGEDVFLSNSKNEIVDSVFVPKLKHNISYGRITDGGNEWSEMTPSFATSNDNAELFLSIGLQQPSFSAESGFYEEDFLLQMESGDDETIYYTLDGSIPTIDSLVYEEPITISDASFQDNVYAARTDLSPNKSYVPDFPVDKATVVRAISYHKQSNCASEVATKVYFVGYQGKEEYQNFPVISLTVDPKALFDSEYGIYTNGDAYETYMQNVEIVDGVPEAAYTDAEGEAHYLYEASNAFHEGKEWEREAVMTCFDGKHSYCFEQDVGIRIAGASTRATPQKSFNVYGRDIYDDEIYFEEELFPGMVSSTFKLRNGGNCNADVKITDAFLETCIEDRNVSIQRSSPCILFLNGEYWGIYNIRERYNEEYLWNYYQVNKEDAWIIDSGVAEAGGADAMEAYEFMTTLVTECDLTYDDVYAMVAEQIDVQSLIDYCCINLYTDNRDVAFHENIALWRSAKTDRGKYNDGKWRWMVYDMDDTLYDYTGTDPIEWMQNYRLLNEPIVKSFLDNEQFRKQFCITLMDISNTSYAYEDVHEALMEWKDIYGEQIVKNHQRFFEADFSDEDYQADIKEIDDFFKNRFDYVMEGLAGNFGLTGTIENVTVTCNTPEGGSVTVNTSQINTAQEWTGRYYNDFPVTLTATAAEGYRFAGWNGDVTEEESTVEVMIPEGGLLIQAVFVKTE